MANAPAAAGPQAIELATPLGPGKLQFRSLRGREEMSRLFSYRVLATADPKADIDIEKLLGRNVEVTVALLRGTKRVFNGLVSAAEFAGFVGRSPAFALHLVPWFWLATRSHDVRIHQHKTVPDILKSIFDKYGGAATPRLTRTYRPRAYCVQYRESDFDFASRLMEEEGISYFFKHEAGKHSLVYGDAPGMHEALFELDTLPYRDDWDTDAPVAAVTGWRWRREVQTGKVTLRDRTFEMPTQQLTGTASASRSHPHAAIEHYDAPAALPPYKDNDTSDLNTWVQEVAPSAKTLLEAHQARFAMAQGQTGSTLLATGARFKLDKHPLAAQNGEYVVFATDIEIEAPDAEALTRGSGARYQAAFEAVPARVPVRPPRRTPKPLVAGVQTATVVGPAGEVVYTDKYGRIKVQFHWDRQGGNDQNSSCFVRLAQGSAGKGFGVFALPRIGHEVVVDFLDGDPDRPIVIGSVYNADNMPPYALPDNKTVSTWKTRSFNGGAADYNELRFDDKQGSEHLALHAQKDRDDSVEHDLSTWVGHDEVRVVDNNSSTSIGADTTLAIGKNLAQTVAEDVQLDIGKNLLTTVGEHHDLTVGQDFNTSVGAAMSITTSSDLHMTIGANAALDAATNLHLKAGTNLVIEGGTQLTIKAGGSSVVLGPDGVSITGTMVKINSGGAAGSGAGSKAKKPKKAVKPTKPAKPQDKMQGKHH